MRPLLDSSKIIVVPLGYARFSKDSQKILKTFALGSCLGLSFYEPNKKWGGLLHIVLPDSSIDPLRASIQPYYFVDTALVSLIGLSEKVGFSLAQCQLKVAGGASRKKESSEANKISPNYEIGNRNIMALEKGLKHYHLSLSALHLKDHMSRNMSLDLSTGSVTIYNTKNSWTL